MQYTALIAGERVDVTLTHTGGRIEAVIGGRSYTLYGGIVEPGACWLNWERQSIELMVEETGDAYTVSIGRRRIAVEILDARKALRRAIHHGHDGLVELRAPMPGKIVRVLAPEGSAVSANQGVVVMEAMKMQNEIKSPKDGTIVRLAAIEGAAVSAGDLIAMVE